MNKVYRIEIGAQKAWIGRNLKLVDSIHDAVPVSEEDHITVMEMLNVPATAYNDSLAYSQLNKSFPTDHSKIAAQMVFNFHSDAGHGWLAVKKSLVRELGLIKHITVCSYMQGQSAYLEEDCDMAMFIRHFTARFGVEPKINYLDSRNNSPIRSMKRFAMEE